MQFSIQYNWSLLILLGSLCLIMTGMIIYLLFNGKSATVSYKQPQPSHKQPVVPPTPLMPQFPNTPMPATPLIRVLETIDLSSSKVEHFIDPTSKPVTEQPSQQHTPGSDSSTNE